MALYGFIIVEQKRNDKRVFVKFFMKILTVS